MARNIPERFVRPLVLLASMPQESYGKLMGELSGDSFLENPEALTKLLANTQPELEPGDARELSLYLKAMAGIDVSSSHRDIAEVLSEMVQGKNLDLTQAQRHLAHSRALELVSTEPVKTLAFIMDSYWRHERPVTDIKMAVDIRPAFDSNHKLLAMTPWQTLLISYGESADEKTIEFALDRDDLESLRDQVENTLIQLKAVEDRLKESGVRIWAIKSEGGALAE